MKLLIEKAAALELVHRRMNEGEQLLGNLTKNSDAEGWARKLEHSLSQVFGEGSEWARKFYHVSGPVGAMAPEANARRANEALERTLRRLVSLIQIIDEADDFVASKEDFCTRPLVTNKIFLVHGRDEAAKNSVARFLEKGGIEVVILHERPNRGRTLISKFQEESYDAGFAVVLVTPDDTGGAIGEGQNPRARQNVVFELGFFIGRLGSDRVCALMGPGVERPSDFDGVVYVPFDEAGGWRTELVREIAAAKIPFDFAKAFSG